jgi:hypothetical protein
MASPSCITGTRPFLDIERAAPPPDFQHVVPTPAFDGSQHHCIFSLQIVGDRTDAAENFGLKFALLGTGGFDA